MRRENELFQSASFKKFRENLITNQRKNMFFPKRRKWPVVKGGGRLQEEDILFTTADGKSWRLSAYVHAIKHERIQETI